MCSIDRREVESDDDPGFSSVFDDYKERHIYICCRRLGKCKGFLRENNIKYTLDLIGPLDIHPIVMTEGEVRTFYDIVKRTIQGMLSVDGNLCVYCCSGRSRSPAFVAGYLVTAACYSQ